jgi:hypothetical protein
MSNRLRRLEVSELIWEGDSQSLCKELGVASCKHWEVHPGHNQESDRINFNLGGSYSGSSLKKD